VNRFLPYLCLLASCERWVVSFGGLEETGLVIDGDADTDGDTDADGDGDTGSPDRYTGTYDLGSAGIKLIGEASGDWAALSIAPAGDVNGDDHDDVLVGALLNDEGGEDAGAAYLIYGPVTKDRYLSVADAKFVGEDAGDRAGYSIDGAGDVDGDGYDDLIIGAPSHSARAVASGAAYLIFGPIVGRLDLSGADLTFSGKEMNDSAGSSVSLAGDVNGDGYSDVLVAAAQESSVHTWGGVTYLMYGPAPTNWDLSASDAQLVGEENLDLSGVALSAAGDGNADGYDDVLVGAPNDSYHPSGPGAVYLVRGPAKGVLDLSDADAKFTGEEVGDHAGFAVAWAGDVDADGYDDVLLGAHGYDEDGANMGAAYLIRGPVDADVALDEADAKYIGEKANDFAGFSVAGAGDVDGDGFADLLVGGQEDDMGGHNAGAIYLLYGPALTHLVLSFSDVVFTGDSAEDLAGTAVSTAGDVDADGHADLLLGATQNDGGGEDAGAAYLILHAAMRAGYRSRGRK
jgi:hypothetical protein